MMTWKILRFPVKNVDIAKELFVMYNATVRALSNWAVELSYEGSSLKLGSANPKELAHCASWLKSRLA